MIPPTSLNGVPHKNLFSWLSGVPDVCGMIQFASVTSKSVVELHKVQHAGTFCCPATFNLTLVATIAHSLVSFLTDIIAPDPSCVAIEHRSPMCPTLTKHLDSH